MQLELTNLTLRYLIEELKPLLEGAHVNKIQELPNNWLKIKLHTKQGTKDLIISPSALYFTSYSIPAKMQTSGFGAFLRKHLSNKRIISVSQKGFDRVVILEFENFFLIAELFARGNIIFTNKNHEILSPLYTEHWKDRTLKKGFIYKFPASKGINPAELSLSELISIAKKGFPVAASLIKEINISPFYAEIVCDEAGVERKEPFSSVSDSKINKIHSLIKEIYSPKEFSSASPVIFEGEKSKILLSFPQKGQKNVISFKTLSEALDKTLSKEACDVKERVASKKSEKETSALEFSYSQQLSAKENAEKQIPENRIKAEIIYANYNKIDELLKTFKELHAKKFPEKQIEKELSLKFPFLKSVDIKNQKLILEL